MTWLTYDGSFAGLMTAFFEVYEYKIRDVRVIRSAASTTDVFASSRLVITSMEKATRVWNGLKQKLSISSLHDFYACYLSELAGIDDVMLAYVRIIFYQGGDRQRDIGNPTVLKINQVARKVFREKHRMEAFVRFKRTPDGTYFAIVEPDMDVLPLIVSHFKDRYADQHWLIYDARRCYGIYYNKNTADVTEVSSEKKASQLDVSDASNILYEQLWRDYFKHVDIPSRRNVKLHLQHVPVRYWKFLTEKQT